MKKKQSGYNLITKILTNDLKRGNKLCIKCFNGNAHGYVASQLRTEITTKKMIFDNFFIIIHTIEVNCNTSNPNTVENIIEINSEEVEFLFYTGTVYKLP